MIICDYNSLHETSLLGSGCREKTVEEEVDSQTPAIQTAKQSQPGNPRRLGQYWHAITSYRPVTFFFI